MTEISVRDLRPGTVVELPSQYQGENYGMFTGAELKNKQEIMPHISILKGKSFMEFPCPVVSVTEKFKEAPEAEAIKVTNAVVMAMGKETLAIPHLGITSGSDPEIFVLDEKDQVIPAWEFLPSEEEAKKKQSYNGPYAFWDGFQAEYTPVAGYCLESFGDQIREGLRLVLGLAQKHNSKAHLTLNNTVTLSKEILESATDEQIRFRCSPSYNVYRDVSEAPPDPRAYPLRFAGGHIHIGRRQKHPAPVIEAIVRGLDSVLGVAGVSLAAGIDSAERRKMYGRVGEFRLPSHGIEYRVLSNFWLSHPAIYHLVFELMRGTVKLAASGLLNVCWEAKEEETRAVVNDNDITGARKILERNKHVLVCLTRNVWGNSRVAASAVRTIQNGIEVAVKDPTNIYDNWDLGGKRWRLLGKQPGGSWASQAHFGLTVARNVMG